MLGAIPQTAEYLDYADAHWHELIERYEPSVLWNDIGYPAAADLDALFASYFARVPDGVVNNRFDFVRQTTGDVHADFLTPEYSTEAPPGRKWESCRGIGTSFGFNREEGAEDYLDASALVRMLVDVVAGGGNLLLNIGPTGAGAVPWLQAQPVLALGWWLRANGEAVYGTRPWPHPTSGRDAVRFTATDDAVYAIAPPPDQASSIALDVHLDAGTEVALLGHDGTLAWQRERGGVRVHLPEVPASSPALSLRLAPRSAVRAADTHVER
jgi:alpha-L-fucosidase